MQNYSKWKQLMLNDIVMKIHPFTNTRDFEFRCGGAFLIQKFKENKRKKCESN